MITATTATPAATTTRRLWITIVACALLAPALASAGTSAWRCGPEGRIYSDEPCPGGREIALPEPRPAADVQAAERLAAHERATAERMRRDREVREAAAIAATTAPVSRATPARPTPPKSKPAKKKANDRDADGQTWRATAPASRQGRG